MARHIIRLDDFGFLEVSNNEYQRLCKIAKSEGLDLQGFINYWGESNFIKEIVMDGLVKIGDSMIHISNRETVGVYISPNSTLREKFNIILILDSEVIKELHDKLK